MKNLLNNFPVEGSGESSEHIDFLLAGKSFRVERIVSQGHASPPDFWYDQPQDEWVLVLQGKATLQFADKSETISLKQGDYLHIAAHRKHRVDWTTNEGPTIWLAIHFDA